MSTEVLTTQPGGAPGTQVPILSGTARVNLMPPEILQARGLRRTQGWLAASLVAVLGLAGGAYAVSAHDRDAAAVRLADSRAASARLQGEAAKYAEVPALLNRLQVAEAARSKAMANEIAWYGLMDGLSRSIPSSVWITSVAASLDAAGTGTPSTATAKTNPLATPGIGTVTINAAGPSQTDAAPWLEVLAAQQGMATPYLTSSVRDASTGVVSFTTTATLTNDALTNRFAGKGS